MSATSSRQTNLQKYIQIVMNLRYHVNYGLNIWLNEEEIKTKHLVPTLRTLDKDWMDVFKLYVSLNLKKNDPKFSQIYSKV